jgi:alpha-1,6-mannosyltransferase
VRDPQRLSLIPAFGGVRAAMTERVTAGWAALGLLVVIFAVALASLSPRFGYDFDVAEMPVPLLVAILVGAGLVYCLALPPLIRASRPVDARILRIVLAGVLLAGLAARLALFASEPMLEDDYQRYLWDGAVTAAGADPYAVPPQAARALAPDTTLGRLAVEAGPVIKRINHSELTTLYPPVAQAAFALAHAIAPWSLAAWRALALACDLATLALILALLHATGRSPLWSALYWWNPLVLKELFNSAHMDVLVLPPVLLGILLASRSRSIAASASLILAAGAKLWPALLLPLALRPLAARPAKLMLTALICLALLALLAAPLVQDGFGSHSGLAAYAARWQTSSALFPTLQGAVSFLLAPLGLTEASAGIVARSIIAMLLIGLAGHLSLRPIANTDDLLGRASLLIGALVLLSPAQFPWYAVWFAPFLAFRPWSGFLILTATAPLYYMSFYLTAAGEPELFRRYVIWLIWVPVWTALAIEALRNRTPIRIP